MDFIHIADVHLGASPDAGFPWNAQRTREIWDSFKKLVELVRRERPKLLLIAGDLFHRQPLGRELKEVNYLFSTIPDTQVVLIAGNHDYIRPDSWYLRYPWEKNVTGLWEERTQRIYIPQADTWVYGFSYHGREITEARYDSLRPGSEPGTHILLAHGGDEKHVPIQKEKLAASGFDYIALGHIHRPGQMGEQIRYAGALEPLDRNDRGPHGFVRGSVENRQVYTKFVPWACRSYILLEIPVTPKTTCFSLEEELGNRMEEEGRENLFLVALKGKRDPQIRFDEERISSLGNVVETADHTRPDYDLEQLEDQYRGSMVAEFIRRLKDKGELEQKALDYGLEALLETGKRS